MNRGFRGLGTVVVAGATAICGLLMLGGVGPAGSAAAPTDAQVSFAAGLGLPHVDADLPTTVPPTSAPDGGSTSTTSTEPSTSTTSTASTTSRTESAPSPVPRSVSASTPVVGVGGIVEFAGECQQQDGEASGPVVVWVIADTTEQVDTGLTATNWTYRWTAPTDPARLGSYTFQFWCGDPSGWQGGYPAELQQAVDMVAQAGPAPTTSSPPSGVARLSAAIPETD